MKTPASLPGLKLTSGGRVCIVGGGPAGSFAALHLLNKARQMGIQLEVLIFEARHFSVRGAASCKGCAGILSSRLLKDMEEMGIPLPEEVVQSELHSYAAHVDNEVIHIRRRDHNLRIVSIYRGCGPRSSPAGTPSSFDEFLLAQACAQGARHIPSYVRQVRRGERPVVCTDQGEWEADLLVLASGINHKPPLAPEFGYRPPKLELMAQDEILRPENWPDTQVNVFFRKPTGLVFGAIVPKGVYLNISLLGTHLSRKAISNFIDVHLHELKDAHELSGLCGCNPKVATTAARRYYGDRWVAVGDAAATRLYKDGIGSACSTARAAMETALQHGISADAFRKHYTPKIRAIIHDNFYGKLLLAMWAVTMNTPILMKAWKNAIRCEEQLPPEKQVHTRVLWGVLTGNELYRDLFKLMKNPAAYRCLFRLNRR